MIRLTLPLLLLATPAFAQVAAPDPTLAPTGTYVTDEHHTGLTFRVSHFGLSNYTARLTDVEATLEWNAEDPAASSLTATIDPASVDTDYEGDSDFDGEIERSLLGAGENPEITFTSTGIEITGQTTGRVTGDLAFHGTTLPVVLDVTFNGAFEEGPVLERPQLGFSATTTIDRTLFGSDHLVPNVGAEVEILIQAEFVQQAS